VYGGQSSHIPLKINMSGMIPLIFAQSIIIFPGTIASYGCPEQVVPADAGVLKQVACFTYQTFSPQYGRGTLVYSTLLFLLVVGFTYFYTMVIFNQQNIGESLQRNGGFIPGIRPGERTAQHIDYVLTRITVIGALYLTVVALIPEVLFSQMAISQFIGGTSLLIMVTVTLDTVSQIQSHLIAQQYEGLVKKSRLGGGKRR
jgi:preprotein translocase subunit SecY